jgi:hypothetical protein
MGGGMGRGGFAGGRMGAIGNTGAGNFGVRGATANSFAANPAHIARGPDRDGRYAHRGDRHRFGFGGYDGLYSYDGPSCYNNWPGYYNYNYNSCYGPDYGNDW